MAGELHTEDSHAEWERRLCQIVKDLLCYNKKRNRVVGFFDVLKYFC